MITYRLASAAELTSVNTLLHTIDASFPIPLSTKTNLDELASKFINKGYCFR